MNKLLKLSSLIDLFSEYVGRFCLFLVFASVIICALNAIMRYIFSIGSNSLLEIQWYLFAGVFMLGSGYVFMKNAHVRIDFVSGKLSPRVKNIIDVFGIMFVLFPLCYIMMTLSWPFVVTSYLGGEVSSNTGGLIRWPVKLLIPLGFLFLGIQGISELIKRIAFLTGNGPDTLEVKTGSTSEEHVHIENPDLETIVSKENKA